MRLALWVVLGLAAAGCGEDTSAGADMAAPDLGESPVDRGRYLVNNVGACTFCHTPLNPDGSRDLTRLLAGFECFVDLDPTNAQVGCLSSRNLTNDPTGLKNATNEQIKDAFLNGHRTDDKPMVPVMPYWLFHNMTMQDADS